MSRSKHRHNLEVCGDCGAQDPSYASVNRGILLCIKCCSIHRSLGRHISQVKSLQKSSWSKSQLEMVYTLNNNGANNIWEHALLDNNSKLLKKKPTPKDDLKPRAEFIRAKHQQCSFIFKPPNDGTLCVENELGKQLHASVRISNLDTSFRLLINGADPNYFHDEKGTTPLHVAIKHNQKLQAELLMVYGADPTFPDVEGKTPIDYAKDGIDKDLVNRLIECKYEVTDRFINYLMHRKPDHQNGIHFMLPQTGYESDKNALDRLKRLPNRVFEELVMDVYDEVDRRENEAIWLSSADTYELSTVPFLPVDPSLSTTRNQGRQKLARFLSPELNTLIYDILVDTQRRHLISDRGHLPQLREYSQISDDDPLYDSVADDEDYAVIAQSENDEKPESAEKSSITDKSKTKVAQNSEHGTNEKLEQLTKRLQESDSTITNLQAEVSKLRALADGLRNENTELKTRLSQIQYDSNATDSNSNPIKTNGYCGPNSLDGYLMNHGDDARLYSQKKRATELETLGIHSDIRNKLRSQRPTSMYETREGLQATNWQLMKQRKHNEEQRIVTNSLYASSYQNILQCTDQVTKCIQTLCKCMMNTNGNEDYPACAEKIRYAVTTLAGNLQMDEDGDIIKSLLDTVRKLHMECLTLQEATKLQNKHQINTYISNVREHAYNIAKDAKQIITKYASQGSE